MKTPLIVVLFSGCAFVGGIWMEREVFSTKRDRSRAGGDYRDVSFSALGVGPGTRERSDDTAAGEVQGRDRDQEQEEPARRRGLSDLLALSEEEEMEVALDGQTTDQLKALLAELQGTGLRDRGARQLKRALYRHWAHREPAQALAKVRQESDPRLKLEIIHSAFAQLAEGGNLSAARAAFLDLESHRQRQEAAEALAHRISLENIAELASFLNEAAPTLRNESLYRRWGELDPGSARLLEFAIAEGPDALRGAAIGWAHVDPLEALNWAQAIDSEYPGTHAMVHALDVLAESDPAGAATWVDDLPAAGHRERDLIRGIAHRWAQEDLDAALAWTGSLEGRLQREAMQELAHELARQDPQSAARFAEELPPSASRSEVLAEVAHSWARRDVGQALDWASSLGADADRAFHGILETVAERSPQMAADMVTQWSELATPDTYRELAGHLASHWSEYDPAAAAAWAESLSAEGNDVQRVAIERVADHWVEQDAMAASEWIGALPQGEVRDVAAERLVDHVASNDPDSAYRWALSVGDPDHQTAMLHHVFEKWQDVDPQLARSTLETAPITPEQRQDLQEIFQESGPR